MQIIIISKYPKCIAGRIERPRGPRVCDPWYKTSRTGSKAPFQSSHYLAMASLRHNATAHNVLQIVKLFIT